MIINTLSIPIDAAVQRIQSLAAAMNAAAKKTPRREQSFGDQIARAVQDQLASRSRSPVIAETEPQEESFAEQIKKAVEKKRGGLPTQKQHKERVERERERYKEQAERGRKCYPQLRQRTKGE